MEEMQFDSTNLFGDQKVFKSKLDGAYAILIQSVIYM